MNLFIDTSNWNLILILEKDNIVVDTYFKKETKKVSDIFITELGELLKKNNLSIKDIENIFVTTGPGSYTGVRIGLTMAKTLKTLDKKYNVYTINSLKYQAGKNKVISLLDARGNKSYLGIYDNGLNLIEEILISNDELENITKQYPDFLIVNDYQGLDFFKNYLDLKSEFELVENEELLKPIYLKGFI